MKVSKNKVIAFYIGSLAKGGAERVIVNLAEYFNESGYKVFIVTKLRESEEYEISNEITRIIADLTPEEITSNRIKNFFSRISKLRRIWKDCSPNIIVSFIRKNNFMAMLSSRGLQIPVVLSVRSAPEREYNTKATRILAKFLFRYADGIVFQTGDAKAFFPKAIQRKSMILPNSINPNFIRPIYEGERKKEIVTVGRIDNNKNQKMLVDAFAMISKDFPDWSVIIWGQGSETNNIKNLIQKYQLDKQIILAGETNNVVQAIEKSSVFVLTSKCEGMPNALIEGMALGLTPISTDCPCGGPRDLITDGKNGYLIEVDNVQQLAIHLEKVLSNQQLRDQLGQNASKIQETLHPDKVNQMWKHYLEDIISK